MTTPSTAWAVVLHYRVWRETENCVRSLMQSDYPDLRVLVVDNGSADGSDSELRARLPVEVQFLSLPANRFYAAGMNAGIAWVLEHSASCPWVLVLNNDTLVDPTMVSRLLEAARSQSNAGIIAPVIYYASQPERVWSAGAQSMCGWPFPREVASSGHRLALGEAPFTVDYVTGCAMLLRREALERVGAFDTRYRMYYEDADLCQRMRLAGYRVLVAPQAHMWHLVARTAAQEPALNRYHHTRNRWRFYMEHTRGLMRPWAALLLLLHEAGRAFGYALHGKWDMARAQSKALLDGLFGADSAFS